MYRQVRQTTYDLLAPERGGTLGRRIDWFIMALIATNVVAVMLQTVDPIFRAFEPAFRTFELVSVVVFTVEYLGRAWSVVEDDAYDNPIRGRLRFLSRPLLLVDLLAILPFYLLLVGTAVDLRFLRALRLVRLLRLIKIARYSESLSEFRTVIRDKKPDLVIAVFANSLLLTIASSVMYYIERNAQPDVFGSIPETMWWGVATLTTVGYGDAYPITPLGRAVGAIVAILGIGLFALPASILASGFIDAATDGDESATDWDYCPHCGERLDE